MGHDHAHHDHGHEETENDVDCEKANRSRVLRKLYTATALCATFLLVEVIGGYLSGSLAVLSDAAHLFADLASFAVAIGATHLASMPATNQHTFGLKRMESLAALFSMVCLAIVSIGLAFEALRRLYRGEGDVNGKLMSEIAFIGVIVNLVLAWVLGEHHIHLPGFDHGGHGHCHEHEHGHEHQSSHDIDTKGCDSHGHDHHQHENAQDSHDHSENCHDHEHRHDHQEEEHDCDDDHDHNHHHDEEEALVGSGTPYGSIAVHNDEAPPSGDHTQTRNINLHAAYIHVLGDLAQSVAVMISGLVIWFFPSWTIVDPLVTLLFCAMVFYSTLGVLRTSIAILLEEVPPNIAWQDMYNAISAVEGVEKVHDLHIWSISHGIPTLSVHCRSDNPELALERVYRVVKSRGIKHATIQVQSRSGECLSCSGEACDTQRLDSCH